MLRISIYAIVNHTENTVGNLRVMQNPCFLHLHTAKHGAAASFRLPVHPF